MIFTDNLFNDGSGIEVALGLRYQSSYPDESLWTEAWARKTGLIPPEQFQQNCKKLLKPEGAHLHLRTDLIGAFPQNLTQRIHKELPKEEIVRAILIPQQTDPIDAQII